MLHWGLGHASRSIPLIQALHSMGSDVKVAADGRALSFIQKTLPGIECIAAPTFEIRYPHRIPFSFAMGMQLPAMIQSLEHDEQWTEKWVAQFQPDLIISDHRLGCWHPKIPCILICHQLNLPALGWQKLFAGAFDRYHQSKIRRFQMCWIPDFQEQGGLSGGMSHPPLSGIKSCYLGSLSHLTPQSGDETYDAVAVLSGPEPQRSYLEKAIRTQFTALSGRFAMVGGQPELSTYGNHSKNIDDFPFLTGDALSAFISQARWVVSRSGYSSVMDYYTLKKQVLWIPTPGQPEQEALAIRMKKWGFAVQSQSSLKLSMVMQPGHGIWPSFPKSLPIKDLIQASLAELERP